MGGGLQPVNLKSKATYIVFKTLQKSFELQSYETRKKSYVTHLKIQKLCRQMGNRKTMKSNPIQCYFYKVINNENSKNCQEQVRYTE